MRLNKITGFFAAGLIAAAMTGCSDYTPNGYDELPPLPAAKNIAYHTEDHNVVITWTLPTDTKVAISDVVIYHNGDFNSPVSLGPDATLYSIDADMMSEDNYYTVKVRYGKYISTGVTTANIHVNKVVLESAFLLLADNIADLADDDERAAAQWASDQGYRMLHVSDLATIDTAEIGSLWIMVDRVGLPYGWTNLPAELISDATVATLIDLSKKGLGIYLSNMATQMTVPLGFVSDDLRPTLYGNGEGGSGNDVWQLNAYLGWAFRDGGDEKFYDRTYHEIYKGLTFEDPNAWGFDALPLIGPGHREDHNCMWDCNIYKNDEKYGFDKETYDNCVHFFEYLTNSLVLATWGHVQDHCVAGIVEFYPTDTHGACMANGLAAYEFNQNSNVNVYQANVEGLTKNIMTYLAKRSIL